MDLGGTLPTVAGYMAGVPGVGPVLFLTVLGVPWTTSIPGPGAGLLQIPVHLEEAGTPCLFFM